MDYITPEQYATRVDSRCSKEFHEGLVPGPVLACVLDEMAIDADIMDAVKKALFYGQLDTEFLVKFALIAAKHGWEPHMGILGQTPPVAIPVDVQRTLHAIVGILTEAGELAQALINGFASVQAGEKNIDDAFDHINLREEYGDVLWYTQLGLNSIGSSIPECITINDAKLEKRYGATFVAEKALRRDLDAERKELEGNASDTKPDA